MLKVRSLTWSDVVGQGIDQKVFEDNIQIATDVGYNHGFDDGYKEGRKRKRKDNKAKLDKVYKEGFNAGYAKGIMEVRKLKEPVTKESFEEFDGEELTEEQLIIAQMFKAKEKRHGHKEFFKSIKAQFKRKKTLSPKQLDILDSMP